MGKTAAEGIALHVVKLPAAKRGFVLLPQRRVMEQSFAWTTRCRLVKDYKRYVTRLAGFTSSHSSNTCQGEVED